MLVLKVSLLVLLAVQQCLSQNILDFFSKGAKAANHEIVADVGDVANPLIQLGITTVASQCSSVKEILKLDYISTSGDRTPNVDDLQLVYTNPDIQVKIPLHSAITELPRILGADLSNISVKIFVHGFTDNPSKKNFQAINEAYRSVGIDAIALDASSLIPYCYMCSSTNVHHIGDKLGKVFAELFKLGMPAKNIHLLGHSLGAHISGYTGKKFTEITGEKVGRITGLDPAGPCFADVSEELRLTSTDAVFVDVIHSNAGVFGINKPVGHADFYPNGGEQQPNCFILSCSHSFSVRLYEESILNPHTLPAVACSSYDEFAEGKCKSDVINYMGEAAVPSVESQFYLQTNGASPLAKNTDGMTYVDDRGLVKKLQNSVLHLFSG